MRALLPFLLLSAMIAAERPANRAVDLELPLAGQQIQLRVRLPTVPTGPCPVIIFSHGLGGSREGYWLMTEEWASAGFAVIQPSHPGSDTAMVREAGIFDAGAALRRAASDPAILAGRPRLISSLIDALPEIRARLTDWPGSFDTSRIGVGGHSFGAWTTLALAGIAYRIPGHAGSAADPRPRAFLALSAPGPGRFAADPSAATRPLLLMSGTEDRQPELLDPQDGIERGPAWRIALFPLLPPGDKFLAVLTGAHHCAFSHGQGARLSGEPVPAPWMTAMLLRTTTRWWQAWLQDDRQALAGLRDGTAVPAESRHLVRWETR